MGRSHETSVYGLRAALAVAEHRPQAIRRVFHARHRRREVAPLLKAAAAARRPYREVGDDELRKLAGGVHHEGVVVVTDPLPLHNLDQLALTSESVVMALDEVANPHNLGAILRSAAWFGAAAVLIPRQGDAAWLSPAAVRVAQGGAEVVPVAAVDALPEAFEELRRHQFRIVGADQRARRLEMSRPLPRPLCLVLGNETRGLSKPTRQACDFCVAVPGTGAVESLNVSVTAGVLLAAAGVSEPDPPDARTERPDPR